MGHARQEHGFLRHGLSPARLRGNGWTRRKPECGRGVSARHEGRERRAAVGKAQLRGPLRSGTAAAGACVLVRHAVQHEAAFRAQSAGSIRVGHERSTADRRRRLGVVVREPSVAGIGQTGELVTRGANVMRGYWNNPKETNLAFRDGMFRTGDIGYQDAEGYIFIRDRLKDMIVTGGENVYSGEVEAVIYQHPAVREVAVFGIPDLKWGELVMACVVLKPGATLTADELLSFCRLSLANYKVPRRVEFSETDLPKNGSGKILKKNLRARFWTAGERAVG